MIDYSAFMCNHIKFFDHQYLWKETINADILPNKYVI